MNKNVGNGSKRKEGDEFQKHFRRGCRERVLKVPPKGSHLYKMLHRNQLWRSKP
jgi:hypothetical protein